MIYFIEDDRSINEAVFYSLKNSGFEVKGFERPSEFWKAMKEETPDLILLDIMLPEEDGLQILRKLRSSKETSDLPIIMVTAKDAEYDKVIGLDSGADDYMTKPFSMLELVSRIRALLRRTSNHKDDGEITVGKLTVNPEKHIVTANGKNVLVAMKFGDDTKKLREMIRQGIMSAGYVAIFIDEVEHNDFITPELLKYIRDSKFVVVDLSHQNNGAYFEEGYAMGLGKPVIQLCKKDVRLHFDIAQKNTIIWETEEEIPERLQNGIMATID